MSSGSHSAASSGVARRAGTAANVIVIGQPWPASACELMYIAARATWAPAPAARPRDVRAVAVARPGQRVHALLGGQRHELVVGGVELDLVDAVAVAVEDLQPRRALLGQAAPLPGRAGAPGAAGLGAALAPGAAALALERLDERDVGREQVVVLQRR